MSTSYKPPSQSEGERSTDSSVGETDEAIPEQLSRIGQDISRTIERAIAEKDDYMVAVKVSHDAQVKLGQLVQVGVFGTRAEAAAFLIDEGIRSQGSLFERVEAKLAEIERLRAELRGLIGEERATNTMSTITETDSIRTKDISDQTDPQWLVGLSADQLGTGLLLVKQAGSEDTEKTNKSNIVYSQFRTDAVHQQAIAIKWVPHTIADETTVLSLKCDGYCEATCVKPGCICDSNNHRCV
jgi:hypothetical protein